MPPPRSRLDSPSLRLLKLWTRLRLPRHQRLLRSAGVWDDELWRDEPPRICRGCWHRYRLRLDIADYHQRGAYFFGRALDVGVQLCLLATLRRGDTCIDVGANVGLLSLLAAWRVGPRGRIIAFEPNPDVYERLLWHIRENRLGQVSPHRLALSDRGGCARLCVPPTGSTGAATLGTLPPRHGGQVGAAYEVPLRCGDDVLGAMPDAPQTPLLVKLDVEGHETAALRGLRRTIEAHRPAILLEVNLEMLPANGTSVEELFALLNGHGYSPYRLRVRWRRLARRWRLRLEPMPPTWRPQATQNVLFLSDNGIHAARLARHILP